MCLAHSICSPLTDVLQQTDDFLDIRRRGISRLANDFARPGPDDVEGLAAFGITEFAVDEEPGVGEGRHGGGFPVSL